MRDNAETRKAMERDLRRAAALEEFAVAYQPQYDIDGKTLRGFEALLRWPAHPVSPAVFIPLAEEIGLIEPIGEWVLKTACKEASTWAGHLTISVNVSPLQFRDPDFGSIVEDAISSAGLSASRLELEITEGALIGDSIAVSAALEQLTAKGIRIALDDFGTGYSSLSYLRRFPFNKLKIDQSFVRSMLATSADTAIVAAIITLGKALGMVTICRRG
jgi:EAL domain-containing protein (putative c-di-GMP-specific phosphodiesterase class I)